MYKASLFGNDKVWLILNTWKNSTVEDEVVSIETPKDGEFF